MRIALPSTAYPSSAKGAKDGRDVMDDGEHEQSILAPKAVDKAAAGAGKARDMPNFKGSDLGRFPSFRLIFGRAIILGALSKHGCFERHARARNAHVEATLNHFFPAQAAARLQQLEQQAAGVANSTVASISSEEYVQHLERLRAQLKKAWANDERVLALKIAIQAAKLGETAAPALPGHVGADVAPACKPYAVTMLHDYLFCFKEVRREPFASRLAALGLSDGQYIRLGEPAVEWVLRCIGRGASYEHFETVVAHYRDYCNDATVLAHIAEPSRVTTVALLGRLGRRFAECPPPPHQRLAVLNEVWKVATRCTELGDYVACATAWLDCLLKHYGDREVKVLLGDVIDHVDAAIAEGVLGPNRAGGDGDGAETRQLEDLVQLLIESCSKFGGANVILASDHFLKLLDAATVSDPVLVHAILEIGRVAHDALDSLSPDGERRHVASLVCGFVDAVDFGRDVERQLGVYVECRAAFHNLDPVLDKVVLEACHLAMCCRKWVAGGQHTERTLGFAKACLAFCHVTIPSIGRSFRRLDLLEHCGHVALLNGCLPHADTFFKAAVTHIPDAPRAEASTYFGVGEGDREPHTEPRLVAFVTKLVGALVAVPGHPDHGPFYLVKGLLNALPKYEHWQKHTGGRAKATLALLPLLAAYAQRRLPYAAPGTHLGAVVAAVAELTALGADDPASGDPPSPARLLKRAELVLDLVNGLVAHVVLADGDAAKFAAQLLGLAAKHKDHASLKDYFLNTKRALDDARATAH
ncbi:hypothetical protein JL722_996 [Aureococcus anophagefferens]|nr:hypothetical protein JL722_996 [Aureococcus anophagefferens]